MCAVHVPLTGPELAALAGPSQVRFHLSVVNSSTVATARINMPGGITWPVATLTVDGTSGNWASVSPGNTIAIGSAAGLADYGLYRVRAIGDATTLRVGETSAGDPGLITQSIRNATFGDNSYVTVYLARFDLWSVIPRIIAASGTIDEDYNATVGASNTTPGPIVNMTINGGTRWAGYVDDGQTYRTVVLVAVPSLWPTSASVTGYSWVYPLSCTLTGGATNTNTITLQVPQSAENYLVSCAVTENNGQVTTAVRQIWSHARTGATAPLTVGRLNSLSWNTDGMTASLTLYDNELASVPAGAMVNLWADALWNGSDVASAATQFIGWATSVDEITEPGLRSADLQIAGPATLLQKLGSYSQWFDKATSPSTWQQLPSTLEYIDFLVYWLARQRAGNLIKLFDWNKAGMSNLTARLPQWRIEAAGNLLAQMRTIAQSYSCRVGCNPDGSVMVRQHPSLIDYSLRAAIAVRATLDQTFYSNVTLTRNRYGEVRRVRGEAFFWDGAATLPTPLLSDAPGDAPGQGTRDERLQGQTVDSQNYLNTLTGLYFAYLNNPLAQIGVTLPKAWFVFYPAEYEFASLSIPAALHASGSAQSPRCIPTAVSVRANDDGTCDVELTLEGETSGVAGITVPVPTQIAASTTPPPIVSSPSPHVGSLPSSANPHLGILAYTDAIYVWTTSNLNDGSPTWSSAATVPGTAGWTIQDAVIDPFSPAYISGSGALNAWFVNTTGIYRIADLLGAKTVTLQHAWAYDTFGVACIDASFSEQGFVAVSVTYQYTGSHPGTYVTHTLDGVNWSSEVLVTPYAIGNTGGFSNLGSGIVVSSTVAGHIVVGGHTSSNPGGGANGWFAASAIFESFNHGASFSRMSGPAKAGEYGSPNALWLPYSNPSDAVVFYPAMYFWNDPTYGDGATTQTWLYKRTTPGSWTDVTWLLSGKPVGPAYSPRRLYTYPNDPSRVVMLADDDKRAGGYHPHVVVSSTGGSSWTDRGADIPGCLGRICTAGDNPERLYLMDSKILNVSDDFGATWSGNKYTMAGGGTTQPNAFLIFGIP